MRAQTFTTLAVAVVIGKVNAWTDSAVHEIVLPTVEPTATRDPWQCVIANLTRKNLDHQIFASQPVPCFFRTSLNTIYIHLAKANFYVVQSISMYPSQRVPYSTPLIRTVISL